MKDFCVVGSGISGATIASLLSKKFSVDVLEKARGLGGRASNRRYIKNSSFDHGLQYINSNNNKFIQFLKFLKRKKIIKVWDGNHIDFTFKKKINSDKFIGVHGNNDISKFLLKNISVKCVTHVQKIYFNSKYWTVTSKDGKVSFYKNVILTCPYPQIKILAKNYLNNKMKNLKVKMLPNITVMAAYKNVTSLPISSIKFKDDILGWAANENSKKRFNLKENLWTIQANFKWSNKFINKFKKNKKAVIKKVLMRFSDLTGINSNLLYFSDIHGWKYSSNNNPTNIKSFWSKKHKLGVCGDWFIGSKIDSGWSSSNNLFKQIKKNPPKRRV